MINKNNKQGFTLIELLVVIAIIGLLSTLSILALNTARARARDAKRIADVKQIQTALEMYYNDNNAYPAGPFTATYSIGTSTNIYLKTVPTPPSPVDGNACAAAYSAGPLYTYTTAADPNDSSRLNGTYSLTYCLGATINNVAGNTIQTATPSGIK